MKQILIILFAMVALLMQSTAVSAQSYSSVKFGLAVAGDDTATDVDQILLTSRLDGLFDITIMLVNTKVSGTVGGTAYIQGSVNGTAWNTLQNYPDLSVSTDTATLANATTTAYWNIARFPYRHIRVVVSTTGTQVSAPVATLFYRKSD